MAAERSHDTREKSGFVQLIEQIEADTVELRAETARRQAERVTKPERFKEEAPLWILAGITTAIAAAQVTHVVWEIMHGH